MKPTIMISLVLVVVASHLIIFSTNVLAASNAAKVSGDLTLTKDINGKDTGIYFSDGTSQLSASAWSIDGLNIFYNVTDGNVGIGTATPSSTLDVVGNIYATGSISTSGYITATGIQAYESNSNGIAGRFTNSATSGKALAAYVNGAEVMKVTETGIHSGPGMTGTALAHGIVIPGSALPWSDFSHSSNVSSINKTGSGVFDITISESLSNFTHTTVVGLVGGGGTGFVDCSHSGGHLIVHTYNVDGFTLADKSFSFIIMKM